MKPRRDTAGFTLIELLVALALTALAALLVAAAVRGGMVALERITVHQARTEALRETAHLLRRLLHTVPPIGRFERGRLLLFFGGDASTLELPLETARGLEQARLYLEAGEVRLALLPPPFPLAGATAAPLPPTVLLQDVSAMRFSYFDGQIWQPEWRLAEKLPLAVRIEMTRRNGEVWPSQIIDIATARP